jgi:hypothetical protein
MAPNLLRQGMEALILQAFAHVDVIGKEVHAGHYDLVGPAGEIILPQVWETMAKPDMDIEMKMWPMPEKKQSAHHPPPPPPPMSHADAIRRLMGDTGPSTRRVKSKSKSSSAHPHPPPPPPPPGSTAHAGPGHVPPPPPPPPGTSPFLRDLLTGAGIPGPPPPPASVVSDATSKRGKKDGKKKSSTSSKGFMRWAVGSSAPARSSSTTRRKP